MSKKKKKSITRFIVEIIDIEDIVEFYIWTKEDGGMKKLPGHFGLEEFSEFCRRLVAHVYINRKRFDQLSKQQVVLLDSLRLVIGNSSDFKVSKPYKIDSILGDNNAKKITSTI